MLPTQLAPCPRGYPVASGMYVPTVRARLLRSFHDAFTSNDVRDSVELTKIEAILLANHITGETHPIFLLSEHSKTYASNLCLTGFTFASQLLAYTPVTDENKSWRINIREIVSSVLRDSSHVPVLEGGVKILICTPLEGFSHHFLISSLIRKQITGSIDLAVKFFQQSSDVDILTIQRSSSESNVVLALADQVLTPSSKKSFFTEENVDIFCMRSSALHAIAVLLSISTDPLPLLLLRKDQTDKTTVQKAFIILLELLMYEEYARTRAFRDNIPIRNLNIRLSQLRNAISILSRAGALQSDMPIGSTSILDEYACLIPSFFGIIKSLQSKKSETLCEFDMLLAQILTGDLLFIKEMSDPGIVGTCFELENSVWSS